MQALAKRPAGSPERIKLIFYLPCLGTGGTERVVLNLCRTISRTQFAIEVCTPFGGPLADVIISLGIPVTFLTAADETSGSLWGKGRRFLGRLAMLRRMISGEMPTVFHTHHMGPLLHLYLLRIAGFRKFGWVHTEHSRTDVVSAYGLRLFRILNPLKGPDLLTGVSPAVTEIMRSVSAVPEEKCASVLNGIETSLYESSHRDQKRAAMGFLSGDRIIGAIGNLRREKNQQLLLKAFAILVETDPRAKLLLCGDGECRAGLERSARELNVANRVQFLGYRLDAHEIMGIFDVYCLPSVYEGLPLSILEAWAAQRPVVATDVIGIRDIVRHGENGLLVPLDDERRMAGEILRVLENSGLAAELAAEGFRLVMSRYDVEKMVTGYESLYQRVARGC
jgi:L-malate glycosyltransferase